MTISNYMKTFLTFKRLASVIQEGTWQVMSSTYWFITIFTLDFFVLRQTMQPTTEPWPLHFLSFYMRRVLPGIQREITLHVLPMLSILQLKSFLQLYKFSPVRLKMNGQSWNSMLGQQLKIHVKDIKSKAIILSIELFKRYAKSLVLSIILPAISTIFKEHVNWLKSNLCGQ